MDLTAVRRLLKPQTAPTVLELDLGRGILSQAPRTPQEALRALHAPTMRAVRDGLRRAATDDAVAGLVVHVGECPITPAQLDELGDLLDAFATHKPTVAYSESFGELTSQLFAYRLATHCSQVWLQPSGGLGLQGVALTVTLLRGSLGKLGVEPEFAQRKEYKTAADQFMATEVTAANREMSQRMADSLVERSVGTIAAQRGLEPEQVRAAVAAAPLTARQALERRLVDRLGYRDEVYAWVRENWGTVVDDEPTVELQYVHRYTRAHGGPEVVRSLTDRRRPAVAVVGVSGAIVTGSGQASPTSGPQAGSDTVCAHLRAAGRDPLVKAVVLRVDSPGGSYVASDAIRREVIRLRESGRPVVASMGSVAASGGYFVSMGADEIVAAPSTLTGSIGVLAGKFVLAELTDKLGLIREQLTAGENAGMFSTVEGFTDAQWARLDGWLDEVYDDFTGKAAADRAVGIDALEPLARGRVWTGADAAERGLVDHLGGVDLALDRVTTLAGLDRDAVALRGVPAIPWLAQFKAAESSESQTQTAIATAEPWPQLLTRALTGSPDQIITRLAQAVGLAPVGVLTMPWRIDLG